MNYRKYVFILMGVLIPFFIFSEENEIIFHKTSETFAKIQELITHQEKGIYLRFGDGDVNLALGQHDSYQQSHPNLQFEMQQAFSLNGPNVLKCLPLQCKELNGWEEGMFPGNHEYPYEFAKQLLSSISGFWGEKITDVYSHVALHFAAATKPNECIEFLKFLRGSNCTVLVGNENIPEEIRELLFGPFCEFIPTPSQQSYSAIDRIESDCLECLKNATGYKIVITSMGCSGRVLQKRLWMKADNVFLFDFGSLMDALCGWDTRAWMELSHFDKDQFTQSLVKSIKEGGQNQKYLTSIPFEISMTSWAGYDPQQPDWQFLKSLYDAYQSTFTLADEYVIPKMVHLIWLGSPLPERCRFIVESWKKFHPDWTVRVWTDEDVPSYPFMNPSAFHRAANYGEKSDIWRYDILYNYGGLYADTDFECLKPFDDLHKSCEFFTGIGQGPNPELWIGILGSIPHHPIMKAVIDNLRVGPGNQDLERIMNATGPYYFTKVFLETASQCIPGTVVPFPLTFLYPFPGAQRHRQDVMNIKREFVKPESFAIHYFSTSWQK